MTATLAYDVCVVGSGAAGSVVAHRAARAGRSVIVVEEGPYVRAGQMSDREIDMIPWLYKDGGLQMNAGMDMFILQGTCVGGSSALSNMVMMRAPSDVLGDWRRLGSDFDADALERSYRIVEHELGVEESPLPNASGSTRRFIDGARALGLTPRRMRKALGDCKGCGNCNIGCAFGSKRSALETYVPWAEAAGARVIADTTVERIETRGPRAVAVHARSTRTHDVSRIEAKQVVVAAGPIGSSALLLKSGIRKNVGTRVSFNGGSMLIGEFDDALDGYDGDQMTWCIEGDGYVLEPTHNPLMSAALTTPGWFEAHGQLMKRQRHLAYAGALIGMGATGRVVQSPFWGHEETHFTPSPSDLALSRRGLKAIARILFAAGARQVILPTHRFRAMKALDEIAMIDEFAVSTRRMAFGSAHPQGGNPRSADTKIGVVDLDFAVHGMDNLFVCDASVFPSCVRVNPVHTVMAMADYASTRILGRA